MTSLLAIFRKRPVRKAAWALVGGMAAVLAAVHFQPLRELVQRAERSFGDMVIRRSGGPAERPDTVLLGIDEASLVGGDVDPSVVESDPVLGMMENRFPWDRRVWAATIDRLAGAGAKLIVLDLAFAEESVPEADQALAEAIARHRDKVVLISVFAENGAMDRDQLLYTLTEPMAEFFGPGPDQTRAGFANFFVDDDGLVRSAVYKTTLGEMNGSPHPDETPVYSLAGEILQALGKPVPEGRKQMRLSLRSERGAQEVYAPHSLRSIFIPDDWERNYKGGQFFKDKIVMIGPTAPRMKDQQATIGGVITGPQLHLQALTCALEGAFVRDLENTAASKILLGLAAVLGAIAWCCLIKRPMISALGALGIVIGLFTVAFWIGAQMSLLVHVVLIAAAFVIAFAIAQTYDLVTERLERGRLHREFRRFVSRDVADTLVRDPEAYRAVASGRRRKVVVLFSDVRGFTSRSEHTDPSELVAQLNEYLTCMVEIVFRHGGTLDKFIGDAVMAHWGALEDGTDSDHARNSVAAAREMLSSLESLNAKWETEGREPFHIGVGLHIGEVLAGEIGSTERTEFGVIGDAVNLASRIEGMTKYFSVSLLVSGAVVDLLEGETGLRPVGRIRVKGRSEPVELHAPSRGAESDRGFADALSLFQAGNFAEAAKVCRAILSEDPADGAAARLAMWAEDYQLELPPEWDGTITMGSK